MDDETTVLENLIDPQIMTAQISAKLPKAIRFAPLAPIDDELTNRPGDTVTVPRYKYIGWSPVNKIDNLNRDFFVLCHD
jgi:hypothetical protein